MSLVSRLHSSNAFRLGVANSLGALLVACAVIYMPRFAPVAFTRFVTEDQWGEYATSVAWAFCAFCSLMVAFVFSDRRHRLVWIVIGLAAFYVAGEEISWGQRIFGLSTPEFFRAINTQGELTLHNLYVFDSGPVRELAAFIIGGWLAVSVIATNAPGKFWKRVRDLGFPAVPVALFPLFVLPIFFWEFRPVPASGEVAELFLGLSMSALAFDQYLHTSRSKYARGTRAVAIHAALILLILIISIALSQFSGPLKMKWPLNHGAAHGYPMSQMFEQAQELFEYIDANPQFIRRDTRLRHGRMLLQAGKPEEAKEVLNQALITLEKTEPESAQDWLLVGLAHSMLGQKPQAVIALVMSNKAYQQELSWRPDADNSARITWWRARTALAAGDRKDAVKMALAAQAQANSFGLHQQLHHWIKCARSEKFFMPRHYYRWIEFVNRDL